MKGIVLSGIKYTDNRDIIYMYTDTNGRKTFLYSRRKKSCRLSPLSIIEFEASGRKNAEMQYLKEFVLAPPLPGISASVRKSAVAMFIGELLYRVVKEEEHSPSMFEFICSSIRMLDLLDCGIANFHLHFMVQLSKHMGFSIPPNRNGYDCFDTKYSKFVFVKPLHPQYFDVGNTEILSHLLELPVNRLNDLKITGDRRMNFANQMLGFYSSRFDHTLIIKSLNVLHEIFKETD
jgi:DNA repair protein RecO (recombination protein O)